MRQHGKVSEVTEKKTAVYVDDQQRILIRQLARSWLWRSELPTWLLIVTVYGRLVCLRGGLADAGTVSGHAAVDLVYRLVYVLTA
ncbi:putative fatty acid desaturase [Klebsiella pneumoniae]|uniref:Putative fatty acid desaturase n=1 Tax=Klebsiella pneumoniae TaxID=573 RepID=A0A2X3FEN5_KLEPN|nr:putative fatty acid desaturase [Klebsiella pneumoniae]